MKLVLTAVMIMLFITNAHAQALDVDDLPLCRQQLTQSHERYDDLERRAVKEIKVLETQKATLIEWLKQAQSK